MSIVIVEIRNNRRFMDEAERTGVDIRDGKKLYEILDSAKYNDPNKFACCSAHDGQIYVEYEY